MQSTGFYNGNTTYNCSANEYYGGEKMYIMDITDSTNVKLKINNFDNRQLDLFLLTACNSASSCLLGGEDIISVDNLPAGPYYIEIDGLTSDDNGTFDLQLTCNNISGDNVIEIGSCNNYALTGDTSNNASVQKNYGCSLKDYPGNEQIYHFKLDNSSNIYVNLNEAGMEAILLSECNAKSCVEAGKEFTKYGAVPGDYYLIIDSTISGGKPYTGLINCGNRLNCNNYETILCGQTKIGTTVDGLNYNDLYSCYGNRKESGKE